MKIRQCASGIRILSRLPIAVSEVGLVEVSCLHPSFQTDFDSVDSRSRGRRLQLLREQLLRENRRSAGPFSHPLAAQGALWKLSEQIRDVSRIADAVALNAESASDARLNELCSDLRRLMQTQQRWTERLENQIWRMESQTSLMRRLQQVLLHGSPCTDQLWELCELIARETQCIPDGLLLLPEPGQRIALSTNGINRFAANSIEHARFSVFAAMSLLPDVRGADLVAGSLQVSSRNLLLAGQQSDADELTRQLMPFAEQIGQQVPTRSMSSDSSRLINVTGELMTRLDRLSVTAVDSIVPPAMHEFYGQLSQHDELVSIEDGSDQQLLKSICIALGISAATQRRDSISAGSADEKLVLTHKLRWHDAVDAIPDSATDQTSVKSLRRPHFLNSNSETPKLSVFAD